MLKKEKAVLFGLNFKTHTDWNIEDSIQELKQLVYTAGGEVVDIIIQERNIPTPNFYVGKGKIEEIKKIIVEKEANFLVCNDHLSPAQKRNIEEIVEIKVIDRVQLILDIFAKRAHTKEAKLQIELAQLNHLLPTLIGKKYSRLGGGIGTRGPGEMKLEYDRRTIKEKIMRLKNQIEDVKKHRMLHREQRKKFFFQTVAIIGYTNAGKSTLFNTLTMENTLAEDKLFATLDPLIRKVILPNKQQILLIDTVGFIHHLPTDIIAAFKATLEEVIEADILLHLIDLSHKKWKEQMRVVYQTLEELEIKNKPILQVFNKIDLIDNKIINHLEKEPVFISCFTKQGFKKLLEELTKITEQNFLTLTFKIPYDKIGKIKSLCRISRIISEKYFDNEIEAEIKVHLKEVDKIKKILGNI